MNSHAQSQAALLTDLQDCKSQLSTCEAEKLTLTQRIDEMHKNLQQAGTLVSKSREDIADMQEKVQTAQARLQESQADTNKAQQLATIELIKSQEHAAQIQDFMHLNTRLQERLEDVRNDYSEQLSQVEKEKQQAGQEALDRILLAEGEIQEARQAAKLATDKAQKLEEEVGKAQAAEKEALDKLAHAEEESREAQRAGKLATDRATMLEGNTRKAQVGEKAALDQLAQAKEIGEKAQQAEQLAIHRAQKLEEEVRKALEAEKAALGKVAQAEETSHRAQQAEKLAVDRAQILEDEVRKARKAGMDAEERVNRAEGESQRAHQAKKLAKERAATLESEAQKAQEAAKMALDKVVQAEGASQKAQQAEEIAVVRSQSFEKDIAKAQDAEKIALDRLVQVEKRAADRATIFEEQIRKAEDATKTVLIERSQAEAQKETTRGQVESLIAQSISAAEDFDKRTRQREVQHVLEMEQQAKNAMEEQRKHAACADQELVLMRQNHVEALNMMQKEIAELKTVSENTHKEWRADRRRCDVLASGSRELERKYEQAVAELEFEKARRHNEVRPLPERSVKLEEHDDNDAEEDNLMTHVKLEGVEPGLGGRTRKRKRLRKPKNSQPPTAECTPGLTTASSSTRTSPSRNFGQGGVGRAPNQVRHFLQYEQAAFGSHKRNVPISGWSLPSTALLPRSFVTRCKSLRYYMQHRPALVR